MAILCSEMARGLASWGVQVAVLDIREDSALKVAKKEIEQSGGEAIAIKADVLNKKLPFGSSLKSVRRIRQDRYFN